LKNAVKGCNLKSTKSKEGAIKMKDNKFLMLGILALTFGLVLTGCGDSGGETEGTFRIRITEIPQNVMQAGTSGKIMISMFPANTPTANTSTAIARWDLSVYARDDTTGPDWYDFYMYKTGANYTEHYVGREGNYDIGFSNLQTGETRIIRNQYLKVNATNTIKYADFL
jgi:hypothetical protein